MQKTSIFVAVVFAVIGVGLTSGCDRDRSVLERRREKASGELSKGVEPPASSIVQNKQPWELLARGSKIPSYDSWKHRNIVDDYNNLYNLIQGHDVGGCLSEKWFDVLVARSAYFKQFVEGVWNEAKAKTSSADLQGVYAKENIKNRLIGADWGRLAAEVSTSYYHELESIKQQSLVAWEMVSCDFESYDPAKENVTFRYKDGKLLQCRLALSDYDNIRKSVYNSARMNAEYEATQLWEVTTWPRLQQNGYSYSKESYKFTDGGSCYKRDIEELINRILQSKGAVSDRVIGEKLRIWVYKDRQTGAEKRRVLGTIDEVLTDAI